MKKRLLALLVVLALCLLPVMTAYAAQSDESFIEYNLGGITEEEMAELNALAYSVFENHGIEVFFVHTEDENVTGAWDYAEYCAENTAHYRDSVVFALTPGEWYIYLNGRAANIFTPEERQMMWDAFLAGETDYSSIAAFYNEVERQLTEKGVKVIPDSRLQARLVDNAELLSASDEQALLNHLEEISERQQFDVVVVTVDSLEGKSPMDYADDFYDYNGYGYGENRDGALLLISMEERDYWITTTGYGTYALTDAGIEYISDQFVSYLSEGNYLYGFTCYADLCDEFVTQARTGEPYDTNNLSDDGLSPVWVPVSLGGGALVGKIPLANMKRKLRSVRKQASAGSYMRKNSLNLSENSDNFLYSNVTRSYNPPQRSSSGGGSSTHFSSSGTSHGGGGGKF